LRNRPIRRVRFLSTLLISAAATTVLGLAAPASAASSDVQPKPGGVHTAAATLPMFPGGQIAIPTWIFGSTEVCATNLTADASGELRYKAQLPWAAPDYIDVAFLERKCINRWWGGVPVDLTNTGQSLLIVEYR
jgi:hypothetical protein